MHHAVFIQNEYVHTLGTRFWAKSAVGLVYRKLLHYLAFCIFEESIASKLIGNPNIYYFHVFVIWEYFQPNKKNHTRRRFHKQNDEFLLQNIDSVEVQIYFAGFKESFYSFCFTNSTQKARQSFTFTQSKLNSIRNGFWTEQKLSMQQLHFHQFHGKRPAW